MFIKPIQSVKNEIQVEGDKSITHRAIMFNSIAEGNAKIEGALLGEDCLSTIECMKKLGAGIKVDNGIVHIKGAEEFKSGQILDVGNSGTTLRLLTGLISGLSVEAELNGDSSIQKRPIQRVVNPLEDMGAKINTNKGFAPVKISPSKLTGITYNMPVASAQVKSAIILAGLNAETETTITEHTTSRDHTELMLKAMGADIVIDGKKITVYKSKLKACDITVPGDISSAAYFMVLGTIMKNSRIVMPNIGVNPTRTGIIDVINSAGGKISLINKRIVCGEQVADIIVESAEIKNFRIEGDLIPRLIDEIPVLAVLACFAKGKSVIADAQELRLKESDRITVMVKNLNALGGSVTPRDDGMIIEGSVLKGGVIDSYGDHRIAMSMAIAGLASESGVEIKNHECVNISFPQFFDIIGNMQV